MSEYKITNAEWLGLIFDELRTFSDAEFQEKVWLKGEIPKLWGSFSESICGLFDDLHFDDFIKLYDREKYCTPDQFSLLKKFHDVLDSFIVNSTTKVDPRLLLADPEWEKIQLLAKRTLEAFGKKTKIL